MYLKPSVRWPCARYIWYKFSELGTKKKKKTVSFKFELKFSAHLGVLYGYFHICCVSYIQSFQNISEEELLKRENSVQEKCLNNDNSWIHFYVLITSSYFIIFQLQMSQMCIMRAHIVATTEVCNFVVLICFGSSKIFVSFFNSVSCGPLVVGNRLNLNLELCIWVTLPFLTKTQSCKHELLYVYFHYFIAFRGTTLIFTCVSYFPYSL